MRFSFYNLKEKGKKKRIIIIRIGEDAAPADTNPACSAKWKPIKEFHRINRRQIYNIYIYIYTHRLLPSIVTITSLRVEMKPGSRKMEQEEQDLLLFGDILKRDEESLLQPESVELEPAQGTYLSVLGRKSKSVFNNILIQQMKHMNIIILYLKLI